MSPKRRLSSIEIDEIEDSKPSLTLSDTDTDSMKDIKTFLKPSTPHSKKAKTEPMSATPTTPKPKKSPNKASPTKSNSSTPTKVLKGGNTAKSILAEMIIEIGMKSYDRNLVESETGLTKAQQIEMLKKGRGSLWKALYGHASTL
ncbi:uncharacterized protein IL334_000759 [Kwoniella shivajii]|uniref:Uncharacterized protein n=1 Tax=Kwoniella shivajii TaxID=564305 RepID=A0ABZ1CQ11_9TREE|nr:hypothetical protein IL334_000759 [Kwoniella shivajii]